MHNENKQYHNHNTENFSRSGKPFEHIKGKNHSRVAKPEKSLYEDLEIHTR